MSNVANNDTAATMARIAELEAMQAELKALKAKVKNTPRLKVSTKGAISVYGLQRMPVTLYAGQWERIIAMVESGVFADFIAQNESALTRKGEQPLARPAVEDTPSPAPKATKKGKKKDADGPTSADLAKIEALNKRVQRMPATDIFDV
tara:strand:- start:470 stop:916 length:447 start_codon:yes stop_codon:yes gene_type:complete